MKMGSLVAFAVAAACAIVALAPWHADSPPSDDESGGVDEATARPTAAEPPTHGGRTIEPRPAAAAEPFLSAQEPPHAGPDDIERQLEQFFAEQPGFAIVSLSSIECGATECEIALSGTETNPRYVDAYSGLFSRLLGTRRNDFRILSGGLGTREIAPGAREYVMSFEYQPFVDLSPDSVVAARQYAACAAAWRRQTENPTPTDVAREYLAEADRYVALASAVLGEAEGERIAAETRGGPLIRECRL